MILYPDILIARLQNLEILKKIKLQKVSHNEEVTEIKKIKFQQGNSYNENFPYDNSKAPSIVMVHDYNNVSVVSQGGNTHFESAVSNSEENIFHGV